MTMINEYDCCVSLLNMSVSYINITREKEQENIKELGNSLHDHTVYMV